MSNGPHLGVGSSMNAVRAASVVFAMLAATSCKATEGENGAFAFESSLLQEATTPAGARIVSRGVAKHEFMHATEEWRISASQTWPEYTGTVLRALEPRYRCAPSGHSFISCFRFLPGDSIQIDLVPEANATGLLVLARMVARPD
jgi:hypothetical protein